MYKCKECGQEYETKPDFCDCGNDEFEELKPEIVVEQKKTEQQKSIIAERKIDDVKQKVNIPHKKTLSLTPQNILSIVFFVLCIITSFIVIFFAWNPKEKTVENIDTNKNEVVKTIPNIDKFWNNSVPQIVVPAKKEEETITPKVVNKPVQTTVQPKQIQQKTVTKQQVQKTQPKTTTVKLTKNNTSSEQAKKQEQAKQAALKAKQEAEAKAKQEQAKAKAEAEAKAKQEAALKATLESEKKQKQENEKKEFAQYKTNLRNTLGHKIDFTKVVGDGSCAVAFKLDSSGKLINRSFAQQSSNITLNDAVYNAIMSTPTYTPPPNGYKNELLTLYIKFYNGNFEITLK